MLQNKLFLYVLNHPLVKVFLAILSFIVYPIHKLLTPPPTTCKSPPGSPIKKSPSEPSSPQSSDDSFHEESLFPEPINYNKSLKSSIKPCSTGVSSFLPFKNEQGEIEWTFADTFDEGLIRSFSIHEEGQEENISPTISNSSNNDSIMSGNNAGQTTQQFHGSSPKSFTTPSPPLSSYVDMNGQKSHQCPHCEANFKLRGYLTRHLKKHSVKKAYRCPFHKFSSYIDENNITHQCHPTGGFSRRDTYKTHLKSRHFRYPKGTKTKERSKSAGMCSMCGEQFPSPEMWCEIHIEGGECKFLPAGFKGKSRIKNRLMKELKKKGMNVDDYQNYAHLVKEVGKGKSDDEEDEDLASPLSSESQSPVVEKSHQNTQNTQNTTSVTPPQQISSQVTPPSSQNSVSSSTGEFMPIPQQFQQPNVPFNSQPNVQISSSHPQSHQQPQQNMPVNEYYELNDTYFYEMLDYDDDYCLDVDQLNNFSPSSPESPHNQQYQQQQQRKHQLLQQQYQLMQNQMQVNLMMMQNGNHHSQGPTSASQFNFTQPYSQEEQQPVHNQPSNQNRHQNHQFPPQQNIYQDMPIGFMVADKFQPQYVQY